MEQSYEKNLNLLTEFLEFLKYKIENGMLTLSEMEGVVRMLTENITLIGTAEEIAGFYHRTPQDVRNVVSRKMFSKPKRRVHYDVAEFMKAAPSKWKK